MKRFPSIKKNSEYQSVYKNGCSRATGLLVMYLMQNGGEANRLGVSVSRKVGNSVVRHTFVRRMREIFKFYQHQTMQGYDIIIVARNHAGEVSFEQLKKDYMKLLLRHDILSGGEKEKADLKETFESQKES